MHFERCRSARGRQRQVQRSRQQEHREQPAGEATFESGAAVGSSHRIVPRSHAKGQRFTVSPYNRYKLSAITPMPTTTPMIDRCSWPNDREIGTNSSRVMNTMIPATAARM